MPAGNTRAPYAGVFGTGVLITCMVTLNGELARITGQAASLLFIHASGLIGISILIILRGSHLRRPSSVPAPWHLYTGGLLGVIMIFGNNLCFLTLGVSVTLAAGVMGQLLGSLLIDTIGLLGMKRYPQAPLRLAGLAVACIGLAVMVDSWAVDYRFVVLAVAVGVLTILQMTVNARLASHIGLLKGVRVNYIGGIIGSASACLLMGACGSISLSLISSVPLHLMVGGGLLGVAIVASINFLLSRIPTVYSSLLIFLGQIISAVMIDRMLLGIFSYQRVYGIILIGAGIMLSLTADRMSSRRAQADLP